MGERELIAIAPGPRADRAARELSLSAAARERPNDPAVITDEGATSFARLSALTRDIDLPARDQVTHFRARSEMATLLRVLRALDVGRTFIPLHPKLTDAEAQRLIQKASSFSGDRAALLATSGTSGTPKLAIIGHEALHRSAKASAKNLGFLPDDRWLLCMPLAHVGGLSVVVRSLVARAPVVLLPRFEPEAVLRAIETHRATMISVVPAMLTALLRHQRSDALRALRVILVGGAPFSSELRRAAHARGIPAIATYGCTEMASQIATQCPAQPSDPECGDCGLPLDGVEVQIHGEHGEISVGNVGRIVVRGPMRMRGYVGEPELAPDAWLDTRDLGFFDAAGRLHVVGRSDDMIVTGGENVHPTEVERSLAAAPGVLDVLVVGLPDSNYGQVVAALFALAPTADAESVLAHAQSSLASFKQPRRHLVVDAIPRTNSGKPDRRAATHLLLRVFFS